MFNFRSKYWQVAKHLTTAQLQIDNYDDVYINDLDLFNAQSSGRGHNFFLGYYSHTGLKKVIERYGIFDTLARLGFKNLEYKIDTDDPYVHKLTFFDRGRMIIELVLKRETIDFVVPFSEPEEHRRLNVLAIEWLAMQNPDKQFSPDRPRLPGQKYPGLGLASKAVELLMIAAWRLKLAGLTNSPQQYHNAYLYSRIFFYLDPCQQAMLMALSRDLARYPLAKTAWAMEYGAVYDEVNGKPFEWFAARQIVPLDAQLKRVFNSWEYRRRVKKMSADFKFRLDEDKYVKIRKIKEDK